MEVNIIEETKNSIQVEIKGEDHTLCNIFRQELNNSGEVDAASYNLKHPKIGNPIMAVIASGKPKKAFLDGVSKLKDKTNELRNLLKKLD